MALDQQSIDEFKHDGFVAIHAAVPGDVAAACQEDIGAELVARGIGMADPATWHSPVVRFNCPDTPAFNAAGTQPELWSIYDQLLGRGSWLRRTGMGGTIPVRFPHPADPGDAGWHIDVSFEVDGKYRANYRSKERGLLVLFLLTDVSERDAPTELKIGSHLDLPNLLLPFGDAGAGPIAVHRRLSQSTLGRPSAFATGRAGDVFVCHPFLVHRATWPHRGEHPRAIAQPGIGIVSPFSLDSQNPCPVEEAILSGLASQ